jgi:hypothetical protein
MANYMENIKLNDYKNKTSYINKIIGYENINKN